MPWDHKRGPVWRFTPKDLMLSRMSKTENSQSDAMFNDLEAIKATVERSLPPDVVEAMRRAGIALRLDASTGSRPLVSISEELAERELLEEIVAYRKNVTGVDNTLFISPKGLTQHAPRIKLAIEPPDSINPNSVPTSCGFVRRTSPEV